MKGFKYTYFTPPKPREYPVLDIPLDKNSSKSQKARTRYRITIKGVTMSARGWAKKNGIPYMTVSIRLRNGWNQIRAVTVKDSRRKPIRYGGKLRTITELAKLNGMNVFTLFRRIRIEGLSMEQALSKPIKYVGLITQKRKQDEIEEKKWRKLDLPVLKMDKLKKCND